MTRKDIIDKLESAEIDLREIREHLSLEHAFLEHHVETIDDLMTLSLNDLLNMDGIGSETLRLLIKKLNSLGFDYYPVVKTA